MIRHFAREVRDISVETFDITVDTLTKFFREIGELGEAPDRTRQGIVAACSVVLATFLALLLEIQSPSCRCRQPAAARCGAASCA